MKDDVHEVFRLATGHFFKEYRKKGGTQQGLARELGISQSYVSSVLSGARSGSLELQSRIAHILSGMQYEEYLATGRRMKNGIDPEIHDVIEVDDSIDSLLARLSHYVIDHKRIEDELTGMRDFYEKIVENLQSGVIVFNGNDDIKYMNRFMERIIGVEENRIVCINQQARNERFSDLNLDEIKAYYQEAKDTREPVYFENVFVVTSEGNRKLLSGWMIPIQRGEHFDGMLITLRDTTRLQKVNQSLLATIEYVTHPVGLALQDYENGRVTAYYMNRAARKLFRIDEQALTHEDIKVLMQKAATLMQNGQEWLMHTAMNFKGVEHSTMEILFKDGRKFIWDSRALRDDEDSYCGRYVIIKEIRHNRRRDDKIKLVKG